MKVAVDGAELFYITHGAGRPMIVMHGGLGPDHTYFRPWLDALGNGIAVTYYDHRGGGRSSRLESFDGIRHETLVNDADRLRAHLGHEKMVLFGHSYGGMLALEYALRYQHHLAGLVLCCTAPAWDYGEEITGNATSRGTKQQLDAVEKLRAIPIKDDDTFRDLWVAIQPLYFHHYDPRIVAAMDAGTRYSASAYNLSEILLADFSVADRVHEITVPTLILAGRDDWVTPPSQAERLHDALPQSELVIFEGSGHYPFIEEHAMFIETLSHWISEVEL